MKMYGIKALCGETKSLHSNGLGSVYEVFVNRRTGHVWGNYYPSRSTYAVYDDPDVIPCGYIDRPAKMADIAERIRAELAMRAASDAYDADAHDRAMRMLYGPQK